MLAQVESGLDGQPKRLINQSDARNEPVELVTSDQVYDGDSGSELSVLSSTMFEGDAFQFLRDAGGLDEKTNETRRLVETNAVLKARACEMCNWRSIICKPLASSPVTPPKQSLLSSLLSHRQPDSQPHKTCGTAPLLSSYPVLRALVCQLRQVDLRNLMLTSKRLYALLNDGDFARRQAVLSGCTVGPCTINLRRCQSGKQEAERNGSGRIVLSDHVQDKTSVCRCCGRETCPVSSRRAYMFCWPRLTHGRVAHCLRRHGSARPEEPWRSASFVLSMRQSTSTESEQACSHRLAPVPFRGHTSVLLARWCSSVATRSTPLHPWIHLQTIDYISPVTAKEWR